MLSVFSDLPFQYWIAFTIFSFGILWCVKNINRGFGLPALSVLATVFVWYLFDALYNDYQNYYKNTFRSETLDLAWWQVVVFLVVFLFTAPFFHKLINARHAKLGSLVLKLYKKGIENQKLQAGLSVLFKAAAALWILLIIGAVFRFQDQFFYYLFPFLGKHSGPWVTSGVGGGMNSFLALANYLQLLDAAIFGVVAALSTNPRVRKLALIGVLLTWPHYIFHRTRKFILVIAVPGVLAWVFLRVRGGMIKKTAIVLIFFFMVNAWFGFIISHRRGSSIATAFLEKGFDFSRSSSETHQGLNMYEELCWIVSLTDGGQFSPSFGGNYFANLVNPIPRSLWPGKPTIGIDYAIARGMGGASTDIGVYATLSNGLIGQGVANFGLYFGPAFAAVLMSLWVAFLSRLDLLGEKIGYIPLFGLGLILTFTMGRDITFLELYPFVFGYMICWRLNKKLSRLSTKDEISTLGGR